MKSFKVAPLFEAPLAQVSSGDHTSKQFEAREHSFSSDSADFIELLHSSTDYVHKKINQYCIVKKDSICCYWTGLHSVSNGYKTPVLKFGPFRKYGKSVSYILWCLKYEKEPEAGFVIMNTCICQNVCLNENHLAAVKRQDVKIFLSLKENCLIDEKIFTPDGLDKTPELRGYVTPHLRGWYESFKAKGMLKKKRYAKRKQEERTNQNG